MQETLELSSKILSDITVYMKYAKYLEKKERRETWEELVTRNKQMHLKKYPHLQDKIEEAYKLVYEKKILPYLQEIISSSSAENKDINAARRMPPAKTASAI